ncbi:aspartic peptidase domain-containing protein [Mycena amicta]|nr:aspartic peptidase domain-containing protein [Mycena amicta]
MYGSGLKGKGKARATPRALSTDLWPRARRRTPSTRDLEGAGGPDGIVLPLQYLEDGPFDIAYTLPVLLGEENENPQNLSLQVDTGSSDLWVASSSCSSSSCSSTPRYDPSVSGALAPANFTISYLVGSVSGPVYWDTVTVGGYSISNQALAAADKVDSEPLESKFSGILGLALPGESIIAEKIHPEVGDTPDGAVWASNLFSITPNAAAPAAPFLSVALERPEGIAVPSILGIGRHPAELVPDPSKIGYEMLYAPASDGPRFWKAAVHGITVYTTNTSRVDIPLGRGASGTAFPSAVLDTGMPVILTTTAVANAIYGALAIEQSSDGFYYMPCTTPLNMTFTLDSRPEIPLHPLDLSAMPSVNAADQSSCMGLIQTSANTLLSDPTSAIGDMILGVPFLRNVYTVMAYDVPAPNGTFPPFALRIGNNGTNASQPIRPRLGLLGLTDPTVALEEFHRLRVLKLPLGDGQGGTGTTTSTSGGGKKGNRERRFVGLCALLFTVRWFLVRRHLRRTGGDGVRGPGEYDLAGKGAGPSGTYRDVARDDDRDGLPTEDEMRSQRRYDAYMHSLHTVSTDRTQIDAIPIPEDKDKDKNVLQALVSSSQQHDHEHDQSIPVTPLPISPQDHAPLLKDLPDEGGLLGGNANTNNNLSMAGIGTARHRDSIASARGRSLSGLTPTEERDSYGYPLASRRPGQVRRVSTNSTTAGAESSIGQAL